MNLNSLSLDEVMPLLGCGPSDSIFTQFLSQTNAEVTESSGPGQISDFNHTTYLKLERSGICFAFGENKLHAIFIYLTNQDEFSLFSGSFNGITTATTILQVEAEFGKPLREESEPVSILQGEPRPWKLFQLNNGVMHVEYLKDDRIALITLMKEAL